ncbi:hypothetical protein [Cellulomonas sp. FA1]|uniref:hypothetical protein n=1 Tax=Cellulomonas sp. FA1 TaxID=1346710 RepID=UPI000A6852FD|nr:hypothetical protein [Cellulomonas sp. FA1]
MTRDDALDVVGAFVRHNPVVVTFPPRLLSEAFEVLSTSGQGDVKVHTRGP